ncbi:MAG: hypothetical protein CME33_15400 [Gimesia sp.]|uniref:phage tail fiber protein n=1 Tax=Gimesia sp. TaxID=2024833 RepID=UPI000C6BD45A|nr:hypothetical protein [Gimesia sp.]MAX37940.1 hypothetical protein [Gimesia sp.]|tara:strand:- start:305 stop:553 length:249 start_codon:yes stop_codon:yes gene_type:complete
MAAFSDYLENKVINILFRDGTFDRPTEIAIGLSTELLSDDDAGNVATKVASGVGYSLQVLGPDNDDWADSNINKDGYETALL